MQRCVLNAARSRRASGSSLPRPVWNASAPHGGAVQPRRNMLTRALQSSETSRANNIMGKCKPILSRCKPDNYLYTPILSRCTPSCAGCIPTKNWWSWKALLIVYTRLAICFRKSSRCKQVSKWLKGVTLMANYINRG